MSRNLYYTLQQNQPGILHSSSYVWRNHCKFNEENNSYKNI